MLDCPEVFRKPPQFAEWSIAMWKGGMPGIAILAVLGLLAIGLVVRRAVTQLEAAGSPPASATADGWSVAPSESPYRESAFEETLLRGSGVTLPQAIAIAQKATGGAAMDAFLDDRSGKPAYRIRLLAKDNVIVSEWVDAASGQAKPAGAPIAESDWTAYDRQEIANLDDAKLALGKAIALAQHRAGGRAVNADVSDVRGEPRYNVDLVTSGNVHSLSVNRSAPATAAGGAASHQA